VPSVVVVSGSSSICTPTTAATARSSGSWFSSPTRRGRMWSGGVRYLALISASVASGGGACARGVPAPMSATVSAYPSVSGIDGVSGIGVVSATVCASVSGNDGVANCCGDDGGTDGCAHVVAIRVSTPGAPVVRAPEPVEVQRCLAPWGPKRPGRRAVSHPKCRELLPEPAGHALVPVPGSYRSRCSPSNPRFALCLRLRSRVLFPRLPPFPNPPLPTSTTPTSPPPFPPLFRSERTPSCMG
jgi:hypothetical protein